MKSTLLPLLVRFSVFFRLSYGDVSSVLVVVAYDLLDRVEPILLGDCEGRGACLLAAELLAGLDMPTLQHELAERYYSSILPNTFYHRYRYFVFFPFLCWCEVSCWCRSSLLRILRAGSQFALTATADREVPEISAMSLASRQHLVEPDVPACYLTTSSPGYRFGLPETGVLARVQVEASDGVADLPPGMPELLGVHDLPSGSVLIGFAIPVAPAANDLWCSEFAEYVVCSHFRLVCLIVLNVPCCGVGCSGRCSE